MEVVSVYIRAMGGWASFLLLAFGLITTEVSFKEASGSREAEMGQRPRQAGQVVRASGGCQPDQRRQSWETSARTQPEHVHAPGLCRSCHV